MFAILSSMNKRRKRSGLVLLLLLLQFAIPDFTFAQATFDPNYVLADQDMLDYNSLSLEQIQNFLDTQGSPLATYIDPITSLRAAQVFYTSAQTFQLNPEFLLALVQKEQSLVENHNPSQYNFDWATGYGVCDSCNTNDPTIQKFRGFYNQVYGAAKRIRQDYLPSLQVNGQTLSGFGPGIAKQVDGTTIVPANQATAIAYTYTPHLHGNLMLWTLWNRYFSRSYPDGSVLAVQEDPKTIWVIENGQRRRFSNVAVFLSRYQSLDSVVTVSKNELVKYDEGTPIKFANYSFVRVPKGTVYLIVDSTVRGFSSPEALRRVGINPEEIIKASSDDLVSYTEGTPITQSSIFPLGSLLQDRKTGGVFWVQDGLKHPIWSREIMNSNWPGRKASKAKPGQLDQYQTSAPVVFRDGDLVRSISDPTVYLISNRLRRPFASLEAVSQLGFNVKNVITTSDDAIGIHALGEPITPAL